MNTFKELIAAEEPAVFSLFIKPGCSWGVDNFPLSEASSHAHNTHRPIDEQKRKSEAMLYSPRSARHSGHAVLPKGAEYELDDLLRRDSGLSDIETNLESYQTSRSREPSSSSIHNQHYNLNNSLDNISAGPGGHADDEDEASLGPPGAEAAGYSYQVSGSHHHDIDHRFVNVSDEDDSMLSDE